MYLMICRGYVLSTVVFSADSSRTIILVSHTLTSAAKWPHPVDFERIFSSGTALSTYLFNIRQSIQGAPEVRLPLSRVGFIPSIFILPCVRSPCSEQRSIVHAPAMPAAVFPRHTEGSVLRVSLPSQAIETFVDLLHKPVAQT